MKLKPTTDDREVIPPRVWNALKLAIASIAETYGVRVEFESELGFRQELERIHREAGG